MIANSFALTTGSLVSNAIGAGEGKTLFSICSKILKLGYTIGFPLVAIALLCNRWIIGFYTSNELLIQLAFAPFVVMLLNYTFALPGYVYLNAVGGTGKTQMTFLFSSYDNSHIFGLSLLVMSLHASSSRNLFNSGIRLCNSVGYTIYFLFEKETLLKNEER